MKRFSVIVLMVIMLISCGGKTKKVANAYGVSPSTLCSEKGGGGNFKIGKPYDIGGVTYYPLSDAEGYVEEGVASWYGPGFHGKLTANGETYNQRSMTAAHKTLPLPTFVRVENLENGREIVVRVNDRGPYSKGRIIDLTEVGAEKLGMVDKGTAKVRVSVLSEAPECLVTKGKVINLDKGDFAVQLAAFLSLENAERLKARFGSNAIINNSPSDDGKNWYRVWIIGYKTKHEAVEAAAAYSREFAGAFVIAR